MRKVIIIWIAIFSVCGVLQAQETVQDSIGNFPNQLILNGKSYENPISNNVFSHDKIPTYLIDQNSKFKVNTEEQIENGKITLTPTISNVQIYEGRDISYNEYLHTLTQEMFFQMIDESRKEVLKNKDRKETSGLLGDFEIKLPRSAMPKAVRKILGGTTSRLSVDGRQVFRIGGSSKSDQLQDNKFTLKTKQELNLNIKGKIGDKIHVAMKHNSGSETSFGDPDNVEIRYEGYDDEIVQSIEAGNISLSLTGSEFIKYSVNSEGLFGIKTTLKIGSVDFTVILGKEEAKSETKTFDGNNESTTFDRSPIRYKDGNFYYVIPPEEIYVFSDENDETKPIEYDETGFMITAAAEQLLPTANSLNVYISTRSDDDNKLTLDVFSEDEEYYLTTREFKLLESGIDYYYDADIGLLQIIGGGFSKNSDDIAINYETINGTKVGNPYLSEGTLSAKLILDNDETLETANETFKYLAMHIYDLGKQDIKSEGFEIDITKTTSTGAAAASEIGEYNLDANGDTKYDGDDITINLKSGYIFFPSLYPFKENPDYTDMYNKYSFTEPTSNFIKIKGEGKLGMSEFNLGVSGVLPGSVVITLDNEKLIENQDYTVDYDTGDVYITTPKIKVNDPKIDIRFEYLPFATLESKSLMGVRADWNITDDAVLGGTFIYHTEKVREDHPKIGEENKNVILADIDGELKLKPYFMTRMVDMLPFIRTDEESTFELSGETAMSLPNIYGNDKSEAYIDDLESSLDIFSLGTGYNSWSPASVPYQYLNSRTPRGTMYWFDDTETFNMENIFNNLEEEEEETSASVLALRLKPPVVGTNGRFWNGIMKSLGGVKLDEKKYIEIVVKDDYRQDSKEANIVMNIDVGNISEDFFYGIDGSGKGVLNTEDVNDNNIRETGEDTGLDNIADNDPGDDPNDDWDNDETSIMGQLEKPNINGMENNSRLDTEDLNRDGNLNLSNKYRSYSISLANAHVYSYSGENTNTDDGKGKWKTFRIPIDEMFVDYIPGGTGEIEFEKIKYARIWFESDIEAKLFVSSVDFVGNKWEALMVKDYETDEETLNSDELVDISVVNTQKNPEFKAPPGTETKSVGSDSKYDQAIALDFSNLSSGKYAVVEDTYESKNKLDLLSYEKLLYWVYVKSDDPITRTYLENIDALIRIGVSKETYYEISHPVEIHNSAEDMTPNSWTSIEVDFEKLTYLVANDIETYKDTVNDVVTTYSRRKGDNIGDYSNLGYVTMFAVGLHNSNEEIDRDFNGTLYVDDIRVAEPFEEIGFASRLTATAKFADFSNVNVDYKWQTRNFQTNQTTLTSKSMKETKTLTVSHSYDLDDFTSDDWGLSMPLSFSYSQTNKTPRFKKDSDILVENLNNKDKEQEKEENILKNTSFRFSQTDLPDFESNFLQYSLRPLLFLTTKRISFNIGYKEKEDRFATSQDTTKTFSTKAKYSAIISEKHKDYIGFNITDKYTLNYFPHDFSTEIDFIDTDITDWDYTKPSGETEFSWVKNTTNRDSRTLTWDNQFKYNLLTDLKFQYSLNMDRDLILVDGEKPTYLWGVDIGDEKHRDQVIKGDYAPNFFSDIYDFSTSYNVTYTEDKKEKKSTSSDATDEKEFYYNGNINRNIDVSFTLKNKNILESTSAWLSEKMKAKPKEEKKPEDDLTEEEKLKSEELEKEKEDKEKPKDKTEEKSKDKTEEKPKDKDEKDEDKKSFNPVAVPLYFVKLVTDMNNIDFGFDNKYTTRYENYSSRPGFLYQIGVPHTVSDSLPDSEALISKTIDNVFTASTGINLSENISLTTSPSIRYNWNYGKSSGNITESMKFPDVSLSYSNPHEIFFATQIIKSSTISGNYNVSREKKGDVAWGEKEISEVKAETETTTYTPSLNITWAGNFKTTFSYSKSNSEKISLTSYNQSSDNTNFRGKLDWTFSAESGMDLPLLSKLPFVGNLMKEKIKFKNDLTASVDCTYSVDKNNSAKDGGTTTGNKTLTIQPRLQYEFSRNITGSLNSSYYNKSYIENDDQLKEFSLDIEVTIVF